MRRLLLAAGLAGLIARTALAAPPEQQIRISVEGGFYTGSVESTALTRITPASGAPFWIAERRWRETNGPPSGGKDIRLAHGWIDGRTCPQLEITAREAGTPKISKDAMRFHGVWTRVAAWDPAAKAFRGPVDYEGDLTTWWRVQKKALEPCWTETPVNVDGAEVPAALADAEAERAFAPAMWMNQRR